MNLVCSPLELGLHHHVFAECQCRNGMSAHHNCSRLRSGETRCPAGWAGFAGGNPRAELSSSFSIFQHLPEHLLCADSRKKSKNSTRPTSGSSSLRSPWLHRALIWDVRLILAVQFLACDFTFQRLNLSLLKGALTPSGKGCSEDLTKILL